MEKISIADQLALLPLRANDVAVSGLIWQPLTALKALQGEAKQLIKREQCDYFIVHRRGNRAQCGMISELPAKKNYYSMALMLIDKLGSDWLAIFELVDNRYLLLGIEGGQVVPGCDAIFAKSAEVVDRFNSYKSLFEWKTIYAPSALGLGGESLNLQQVLKSIIPKPAHRVLYVNELNKQSKRFGIKIVLLLLIGAGVFAGWYSYQQRKLAQQEAQRLAALRALQTQKLTKAEPVAIWRQQPPAGKLLSYCTRSITQYPITLGGWQAVGIFCDKKGSKAVYQRIAPATVNTFMAAVTPRYSSAYQFLKNGETAQIDQPLAVEGRRDGEQLQPIMKLASNIISKMQVGSASGRIEDVLATNNKRANFELVSQSSPLILLQDINLEGVVIDNLTATLTTEGLLTWKISGVIYGE